MSRFRSAFWRDERGATAVELGLMVALIALAVVGAMSALSGSIQTSFTKVSDTMTASNNAH